MDKTQSYDLSEKGVFINKNHQNKNFLSSNTAETKNNFQKSEYIVPDFLF